MSSVHEFAGATLPWIAAGLLLAIFFVRTARRKRLKKRKRMISNEQKGSTQTIRR